ncbi:hypothetical protein [Mycolicibacterium bacteremicum]|uniref:hypothetical protein n=1 Tax=Mycolicibacterium bacteremicum TaxID=564198 RepID=UPI0026EEB051|nr:hypothetical protein [Mycolicibacterium bacteremicum]
MTEKMLLVEQSTDGNPQPTTYGVAVILGTTIAELAKWADLDGDVPQAGRLPAWLVQQGRRRTREAQAAIGGGSIAAVLTHWAVRDFGAGVLGFDMVVSADVHQLWMIVGPRVADMISGESPR